MNEIIAHHRGRELEPDAELLELDRDRGGAAGAVRDRIRILAAGEEAGFLAVLCHEVRFGQALKEAFAREGANHCANVVSLAEQEQVQEVTERELAGRFGDRRAEIAALLPVLQPVVAGRRKLLRRHAPDRVLNAGGAGEEGDAKLLQGAAADFGESYAEQNLIAGHTFLLTQE